MKNKKRVKNDNEDDNMNYPQLEELIHKFQSKKPEETITNDEVAAILTNPGIKEAIRRFDADDTDENYQQLMLALRSTIFIIFIYSDSIESKATANEQVQTLEEEGKMQLVVFTDEPDKSKFILAFTDIQEAQAYLDDTKNISGLSIPAINLFRVIIKDKRLDGIYINPKSDDLYFDRDEIKRFLKQYA